MFELDVTLTDFAMALECAVLAYLLPNNKRALMWRIVFAAVGLASLFGGLAHGFFPDKASQAYNLLWIGIFISLGAAGIAFWNLGAHFLKPKFEKPILGLSIFLCLVYFGYLMFVTKGFFVVVGYYFPSVLFLTFCSLGSIFNSKGAAKTQGAAIAFAGCALTILGAIIQVTKISLHPVYLTYNALYHVVQMLGIYFFYLCAKRGF